MKGHDILVHHGQGTSEDFRRDLLQRNSVNAYFPGPCRIKPGDQPGNGCFSAAALPHQGHPLSGFEMKGKIIDDGRFHGGITEGHMLQVQLPAEFLISPLSDFIRRQMFFGNICRAVHHILRLFQPDSHFLDGFPKIDEFFNRFHKCGQEAGKGQQGTGSERTLKDQPDPKSQNRNICQFSQRQRDHAKIFVDPGLLRIAVVGKGLIARPSVEKSVFRAGCLNRLDHADPAHRGCAELAVIGGKLPRDVFTQV